MKQFALVTGNVNKHREAERLLSHTLERVELDLPELQAATTREVAIAKATTAHAALARPVIIEDAGLEFAVLGGFPGPFIKFWETLGGLVSMCRALDGTRDRRATAVCVLAFVDDTGTVGHVEGRTEGTIAMLPRGDNGFGWDAIFIPDGDTRTFGEMIAQDKDAWSHRGRAWAMLRTKL